MIEGLLASKICHDLANRLTGVICAKEVLIEQSANSCCMQDLSNALELMSLNLVFFQNIVVQSAHIANLYDILTKMCKLTGIKINIDFAYNEPNLSHEGNGEYCEENIVCGLLYIIVSNSIKIMHQTEINVKINDQDIVISISGFKLEMLPNGLRDVLSTNQVQVNNINVFAMYIKQIMGTNGYTLLVKECQNRVDLFIRKIN